MYSEKSSIFFSKSNDIFNSSRKQVHTCTLSHFSRVQLCATLWTAAHQAPLSMGFPRQEYWSELPFPSPWDLPDPEIKSTCPALDGRFFTTEPPGKPNKSWWAVIYKMRWKRGIQHFLDKHTWAQKLTNINYSQCCLGVISSAWNLGNCLHSP